MLKVKGESMKDAGICDGDMVIAERVQDAKLGAIVIAELDGEWTMKYWCKDKLGYYLAPANRTFPDKMRPEASVTVPDTITG